MKRQVLVNTSPGDIRVSSGTVTSAIIKALSWQAPPEDAPTVVRASVPLGVPGVVVVDESEVDGEGVSVGRDKPGLVGGRVEVMKTDLGGGGVSSETLMHEASVKVMRSITIQIFFMRGFYIAMIKKSVPTPTLRVSVGTADAKRITGVGQRPLRKSRNRRRRRIPRRSL